MSAERSEGAVLAGRFRLDRRLGEGGMGVVWAAMNTTTRRRVAIKLLKEDRSSDPNVRRRFLREGRAASAVQHPNVVEILDVLELEDGVPAMVMELLDGESLGQRLRRMRKLPLADVAAILLPAIAAVGTAHAHGIVHRDLKPDNIFLARNHEDAVVVKVLDFGIAKMTAEAEQGGTEGGLTGTGAMLGTPYYMAPEQLFTDETIDYRCDIWSLGIILYECLSGLRPTRGENFADIVKVIATRSLVPLESVARDLPPEIVDLVTRMLSFDKDKRPQSLREVRDVLKHYTDVMASTFGEPVLAPVKQNLADSSGQMLGLRKSDVDLLLASNVGETNEASAAAVAAAERGATTTLDAPSMSLETLEALAKVKTGPDTQHGVANTLGGAGNPARRYAMLAGAALALALATGVYAVRVSTTADARATAAVPPSAAPQAAAASVTPEAPASASPLSATDLPTNTNAASAPSASPSSAPRAPSLTSTPTSTPTTIARPRPQGPGTTTAAGSPTSPSTAPTQEPRPPSSDPTARPAGGLVEKPPF